MVLSLSVRILIAACLALAPLSCWAETVLLEFSSPSCGPCQQMRPVVERLIADGLPVRGVDITREPQLAARFGVTQVPTFLVVVDGRATDQVVGATTYRRLHRMLRRAMPASSPRQRVVPLGQSPNTFAAPPQPQTQPPNTDPYIGGVSNANINVPRQNLNEPQPGRIMSLQDPDTSRTRPQAVSNPFAANAKAPSRPQTPLLGSLPGSPPGSPNLAHQRLLAATVKITVDDADGKSAGTGTIVDARSGEALLLTCGHIFRTSAGKGPITVTTFQAGAAGATPGASYAGRLIDFDLERDLALVSIRPTAPVQSVSIAGSPTVPGQVVTSVGCNHGQNPTAIDSRVVSNNRYQGPPNVEVAGAPVEGRSGGGLFNAQGELVGVCFAADQQANEGLYAALPSIQAKLDSLNLTMIYQPDAASPQSPPVAQTQTPPTTRLAQPLAVRGQEPEAPSFPAKPLATNPTVATLPVAEQAALEEIQRRGSNSEVICIIRPQDPNGKSEVITLSNASPAFVNALANPTASPTGSMAQRPSAATAAGQFSR